MGSVPMPNQRWAYRRIAPLRPKGMKMMVSDHDHALDQRLPDVQAGQELGAA